LTKKEKTQEKNDRSKDLTVGLKRGGGLSDLPVPSNGRWTRVVWSVNALVLGKQAVNKQQEGKKNTKGLVEKKMEALTPTKQKIGKKNQRGKRPRGKDFGRQSFLPLGGGKKRFPLPNGINGEKTWDGRQVIGGKGPQKKNGAVVSCEEGRKPRGDGRKGSQGEKEKGSQPLGTGVGLV